jgi:hypothetical protein
MARSPNRFWDSAWGRFPKAEYTVWYGMVRRCHNPRDPGFVSYGARGIGVSARWREDFMAFFADMGPRPSIGHSIDRLDNARGYEPDNCRWATKSQQQRNKARRANAVGAHYLRTRDRWQANINIHGRRIFLGAFRSKAEAMAAYRGARASARVIDRIVIDELRATITRSGKPALPADGSGRVA